MNPVASSSRIESRFNGETARRTQSSATHLALSDIEMLFSESQSTGLLALLPKLFDALERKAGPSLAAHAEPMIDFFHSRSAKLRCIQSAVNVALGEDVSEVNALAQKVAELTVRIAGQKTPAVSDLRRQRTALVFQLSGIIDSRESESGNSYRLLVGSNRVLTQDGRSAPISVDSSHGTGSLTVRFGRDDIASEITGGRIKARIALRDETIPGYLRSLDRLAYDISETVNDSGYDLFEPLPSVLGAARTIALSANSAAKTKTAAAAINGRSNKLAQSANALMEQYRSLIYSIGSDAAVADLMTRELEALVQQRENRRLSTNEEPAGEVFKMQQFRRAHEASAEVERAIDELLQITLTIGV